MADRFNDINTLLNNIVEKPTLRGLFDKKVKELGLAPTAVLGIIGISYRTLNGTLDGSQKMVDATNLIKIANFLQLPKEQVVQLFIEAVERNFPTETISADKVKFIKQNFNLAVLKKAGFIDSITDFEHIERRIVSRLGLRSLFEYRKPSVDVAFSSGLFKPENDLTRAFWIKAAMACFEEIDNPHDYDRQALIKIFPQIRWHTLNEERGLVEIIKALYKVGITVIFQPALQTLQVRGATFNVNDKPCIVLTNYMGFYSTLWFALIHELFHVLFDWEEIKANKYHLTDDSNEQLSVQEHEREADNFAREYLFSREKMEQVKPYINDVAYVKDFAMNNHVHHSIIYTFIAFDTGKHDRMAWARARRHSPDVTKTIKAIDLPWPDPKPFEEHLEARKTVIYT